MPFQVPVDHLNVFFGKMSIQTLQAFFYQIIWSFFLIELYEFLYFGYLGEFLILQQRFVVANVLD